MDAMRRAEIAAEHDPSKALIAIFPSSEGNDDRLTVPRKYERGLIAVNAALPRNALIIADRWLDLCLSHDQFIDPARWSLARDGIA